MNLIDAVRALSEGMCEVIELHSKTYSIDEYGHLVHVGTGLSLCLKLEHFLSEEWALINHTLIFEEVEVVKWYSPFSDKFYDNKVNVRNANDWVKVRFTIKQEIKPKVKRSIKVGLASKFRELSDVPDLPMDAQIIAEWEE